MRRGFYWLPFFLSTGHTLLFLYMPCHVCWNLDIIDNMTVVTPDTDFSLLEGYCCLFVCLVIHLREIYLLHCVWPWCVCWASFYKLLLLLLLFLSLDSQSLPLYLHSLAVSECLSRGCDQTPQAHKASIICQQIYV